MWALQDDIKAAEAYFFDEVKNRFEIVKNDVKAIDTHIDNSINELNG